MKIYLVGGAVRDELLGIIPKEKDYVVIGATEEDMLKLGYQQVGKDFPVFLHPVTKEEYALARRERKTGRGYTGFSFDTSPQVTLEEDLMRRDLTINAMAKDLETGEIIDPYGGQEDLKNKLLRHVSPAFQEDPVRILRVARFAARLVEFGVADQTIDLMRHMVESGEVDALVPERVWKEFERALSEKKPSRFFYTLQNCGALEILFPQLSGKDECLLALQLVANPIEDRVARFGALMYHLTEEEVRAITNKYRIPNEYKEFALLFVRQIRQTDELSPSEILQFLNSLDAFRREERFNKFLKVFQLLGIKDTASFFQHCFDAAKAVDVNKLISEGFSNAELGRQIKNKREQAIDELITQKK